MSAAAAEVVVIGVGNVVLSDDGLGVHAVRRLAERYDVDGVEVVEGGTAGLLLLPCLADARRAIVVDAIHAGAAPGTLVRTDGADLDRALATAVTVHDVGLADLLGAARVSGAWPDELVLHGAQPASTAVGTDLTAPVAAALDRLVDALAADLARWGLAPRRMEQEVAKAPALVKAPLGMA
jgi:hydrogenase maturation protease